MTKRILALDLATKTGWACDGPEGRPMSGVLRLPKSGGDAADGYEFGMAYCRLEQFLIGRFRIDRPDIVAMEAPIPGGHVKTTYVTMRLLYGLPAVTECVCTRWGIPIREIRVQAVKRHMTGNGRCDKQAVIKMCRLFGWDPEDDNAADALAVWSYQKSLIDPTWSPRSTPLFREAAE